MNQKINSLSFNPSDSEWRKNTSMIVKKNHLHSKAQNQKYHNFETFLFQEYKGTSNDWKNHEWSILKTHLFSILQ